MCECGNCGQDNLALPKGDKGEPGTNGVTQIITTTNNNNIVTGNAIIYQSISNIAMIASAAEQTLDSITINLATENILNTDGDELLVEGYFTTAANANVKALRIYAASTQLINFPGNFNDERIILSVRIKRISATSQHAYVTAFSNGSQKIFDQAMTENLNLGTLLISWRSLESAGVAGDIVSNFRTIYKFKNV